MNCIPAFARIGLRSSRPSRAAATGGLLAVILAACSAPASEVEATEASRTDARPVPAAISSNDAPTYRIDYVVTPDPDRLGLWVELRLQQPRRLLRLFDMQRSRIDPESVSADGELQVTAERIVWSPPAAGGTLRWFTPINHLRSNGRFDAHINPDWSVFRSSDAMPAARTRAVRGASSDTHLTFDLPDGWSSVTPYFGRDDQYSIRNAERRFVRPNGWIVLGKLGSRYETISDRRVVVAGPVGQAVRRMDTLAFLNWTLPELTNLLSDFPERITIVSAGEPMWRGGLSAPNSIFIHAERPLISENATSTLLHELMHVGIGLTAEDGADWIIEGLAEYYSLEILRRSGTISPKRFEAALRDLERWGNDANSLCVPRSSGAVTAKAVTVLQKLDRELRQTSDTNLDEVLRKLVTDDRDIRVSDLQSVAEQLAGTMPKAITNRNLPGCGG